MQSWNSFSSNHFGWHRCTKVTTQKYGQAYLRYHQMPKSGCQSLDVRKSLQNGQWYCCRKYGYSPRNFNGEARYVKCGRCFHTNESEKSNEASLLYGNDERNHHASYRVCGCSGGAQVVFPSTHFTCADEGLYFRAHLLTGCWRPYYTLYHVPLSLFWL